MSQTDSKLQMYPNLQIFTKSTPLAFSFISFISFITSSKKESTFK